MRESLKKIKTRLYDCTIYCKMFYVHLHTAIQFAKKHSFQFSAHLMFPWARHLHTSLLCSQAVSTLCCLQPKLEGMAVVLRGEK